MDYTEARDSEWQCHHLGHLQVCTSLQIDNHASTPPLSFLQAGCPSCHPANSVKALKASAESKQSAIYLSLRKQDSIGHSYDTNTYDSNSPNTTALSDFCLL